MSHDYHEGLPGFDAEHVLHDGCQECEGRTGLGGLLQLDPQNLNLIYLRALDRRDGRRVAGSNCDFALMNVCEQVSTLLERLDLAALRGAPDA